MKKLICTTYNTAGGTLLLGADEGSFQLCSWTGTPAHIRLLKRLAATLIPGTNSIIEQAVNELDAYFAGTLHQFTVPLSYEGTEFQNTVWKGLTKVPYGRTRSYSDLAKKIGLSSAVRAVANAVGANPLAIFMPCHRIVGASGIGGYAGGIAAKQSLLARENQILF